MNETKFLSSCSFDTGEILDEFSRTTGMTDRAAMATGVDSSGGRFAAGACVLPLPCCLAFDLAQMMERRLQTKVFKQAWSCGQAAGTTAVFQFLSRYRFGAVGSMLRVALLSFSRSTSHLTKRCPLPNV